VEVQRAQEAGNSSVASLSPDGRFVVFESRSNELVAEDPTSGANANVFVRDRQTAQTERVSLALGSTSPDNISGHASISVDGRYVAFHSEATNLVAGDTNERQDIFVYDRVAAETRRIGALEGAGQPDGKSSTPFISADGRLVIFESDSTNLVPGDNNNLQDVFVADNPFTASPPDPNDTCPADPNKTEPGQCGCGVLDTDTDGDGTADCNDQCPGDFNKTHPGSAGCGELDKVDKKFELKEHPRVAEEVSGKKVTILLEKFAGVELGAQVRGLLAAMQRASKKKKAGRPKLRYLVVLKYTGSAEAAATNKKKRKTPKLQKRLSKRNRVTFKKLKRGRYTVRYRVQVVSGNRKVSQTNWSPSRNFVVR